MRRRRNCIGIGWIFAAFGLGLVLAFCCPYKLIIILIALALICFGIFLGKN